MTGRQGDGRPGGYRKPANPAPVSLPQSGRRTDGGAGDKQPIRTPTGGAYGEAKALTEQQQGAPLAAGGPSPSATPGAPSSPPGVAGPTPPPGAFAPTNRPTESIEMGVPSQVQGEQVDADMLIRQLIARYPSPYLTRLLRA